jgi:hypothetical protein
MSIDRHHLDWSCGDSRGVVSCREFKAIFGRQIAAFSLIGNLLGRGFDLQHVGWRG